MKTLLVLATALLLSGCANFKPADIYPHMPANSSFERHVTTIYGQTKVVYKTGPNAPE